MNWIWDWILNFFGDDIEEMYTCDEQDVLDEVGFIREDYFK